MSTGSITVGAGETLVVGVVLETTDSDKEVTSVTWAGQPVGRYAAHSPSHGKMRIEVWRVGAPAAGSGSVVVRLEGGSSQKVGVVALALANADIGSPISGWSTDDGKAKTGGVTVSQGTDDLAIAFAGYLETSSFSLGGGEIEHADFSIQGSARMWAGSQDGSGSTTLSWSQGTGAKENATVGFVVRAG